MVTGGADEREAPAARGLDRSARCKEGRLEARLRAEGVGVEPCRLVHRANALDVREVVAELEVIRCDGLGFLPAGKGLLQDAQTFLGLGMRARRMQARHRLGAYEL